jgi:hypothetical protein
MQAIILLDATSGFQQSIWRASVAKLGAVKFRLVNEESKKTHPL